MTYGYGTPCDESKVPFHLREWPEHVPATAQRKFFTGDNPTDTWFAVEFYDDAGTLLSRSAHAFLKPQAVASAEKGEF